MISIPPKPSSQLRMLETLKDSETKNVRSGRLYLFFFFLIFFYIYLFLIETGHKWGRGRENETQNLKQAPGSELSAQSPMRGSNSQTMRS